MAGAKTGLDIALAVRLSVVTAFVALSVAAYFVAAGEGASSILQVGLLLSYMALGAGIAAKMPDFEVLAWILLGTVLLVAEAEYQVVSVLSLMATGVAVLFFADLTHFVEIIYPRWSGEVLDDAQASVRRGLMARRASTFGTLAVVSLVLSFLGAYLAPPFVLSGDPAAVVGLFAVASVSLVAVLTLARR